MRDTYWGGKLQRMVYRDGTLKGMKAVLIERGVNVTKTRMIKKLKIKKGS